MINVALLSKWHVHAVDYEKEAREHPGINIHKIWDEDPIRGAEWAKELDVPFEHNLQNIWEDSSIDAVIITTPTSMHKKIIIDAAKYNKHIFTEKVLAFTVKECEEILSAVESSGVCFMISLPRLRESFYLYAQDVVDCGLLGKVNLVRCRVAHDGGIPSAHHPTGWLPERFYDSLETGGGALIDLGAHPIYLTNRLAGPAVNVTSTLTSFFDHPVDDHAIVTVKYENGALGIIETSFISGSSIFILEVHGTKGVLLVENYNNVKIRIKSGEWVVPKELPPPLPTAMNQWVHEIEEGIKPSITKEDAIRLTQINEMAALSHSTSRKITVK
jgi:scyllo-inositol 2-dehydrogenase (NAD+)